MIAKEQKRDIKNKQLGSRNQNAGAFSCIYCAIKCSGETF